MNKVRFWKLAGSEISLSFTWDPFYLGPLKKIINLSEPPASLPSSPTYEQPNQNFGELDSPLAGFPTGVENIGELKSIHGGSIGGLKCCQKYL